MQGILLELQKSIHDRNPNVCGDAPEWVVQKVEDRLDNFLTQISAEVDAGQVETFARGAIRFIDDECGSDGDVLGDTIFKLFLNRHNS